MRQTLRASRFALLALLTTLLGGLSGTALAYDRVNVSADALVQASYTKSLDAISASDTLTGGGLRAGVTVFPGLSVEVGYRNLTVSGTAFDEQFDNEFDMHTIDLAARYELPLTTWLYSYGRAGGSAARGAVTLSGADSRFAGVAWSPGVFGALGIGARLPRRWFGGTDDATGGRGFTLGFAFEVGYAWWAPFDVGRVNGRLVGAADGARPQRHGPTLGALAVHGPSYGLRLTLHF
jgi:hypothetical protein